MLSSKTVDGTRPVAVARTGRGCEKTLFSDGLISWNGGGMSGFIEGVDRGQANVFEERLQDWIWVDDPVRIVDVFC